MAEVIKSLVSLDTLLKLVVSLVGSAIVIYGWVVRPIVAVQKSIKQLTDDVAFLQGDRLNEAHDFYVARGWVSGSKKRELERWYKAYKAAGHNHLADTYIDDLMRLPEKPPKKGV